MDNTYHLDPELVAFRNASRRILKKFNDATRKSPRLADSLRPVGESGRGLVDAVRSHLATYEDVLHGLTREIERLAASLATGNAGEAQIFAAMGRVEAYLDIMNAECFKIRSWHVDQGDAIARNSLASAHEHTLDEVLEWLKNVDDALTDPFDLLKKQGHATPDESETPHRVKAWTDGHSDSEAIDIPLVLKLTEAPKLSAIERWAKRRARRTRSNRSGGIVEGFLFGGILGWWFGARGDE